MFQQEEKHVSFQRKLKRFGEQQELFRDLHHWKFQGITARNKCEINPFLQKNHFAHNYIPSAWHFFGPSFELLGNEDKKQVRSRDKMYLTALNNFVFLFKCHNPAVKEPFITYIFRFILR